MKFRQINRTADDVIQSICGASLLHCMGASMTQGQVKIEHFAWGLLLFFFATIIFIINDNLILPVAELEAKYAQI